MDTAFAKIVTDLVGKDHILIEGRIIELVGASDQVNPMVEVIVRGLRNGFQQGLAQGTAVSVLSNSEGFATAVGGNSNN